MAFLVLILLTCCLELYIIPTFASVFAHYQINKTQSSVSIGETEMRPIDATPELETVRRIDAGILNFKHVFVAMLILLISAAVYLFQQQKLPF